MHVKVAYHNDNDRKSQHCLLAISQFPTHKGDLSSNLKTFWPAYDKCKTSLIYCRNQTTGDISHTISNGYTLVLSLVTESCSHFSTVHDRYSIFNMD